MKAPSAPYALLMNRVRGTTHLDSAHRSSHYQLAMGACKQWLDRWAPMQSWEPPTCKRCAKKASDS